MTDLESLATQGNVQAQNLIVSTLLSAGDGEKASELLQTFADAGSIPAMLKLSKLLLNDKVKPTDPARAEQLMAQAAALGDTGARRDLLNAYYRGKTRGIAADPVKARKLMEEELKAGDATYAAALGDMYRDGTGGPVDGAAALAAYAAADSEGAHIKRAKLLLAGDLVPADPKAAEADLRQAADAGSQPAMLLLMRGYNKGQFGQAPDPQAELRVAAMLAKTGNLAGALTVLRQPKEAATLGADVSAAAALAETAAREGDASAFRTVYAYLSSPAAPQDAAPKLAALVAAKPDLVPIRDRVKSAQTLGAYADFATEIRETAPKARAAKIRALRSGNPNAYVYFMQEVLDADGLYDGRKNGLLTSSTIVAFSQFCKKANIAEECIRGPLSGPAASAFARTVAEAP
ncbi:tetratricopeptide repeat protein [Phaeovulum sp. W22_SRMD_FR3]|uniref:tetratricopeptide repeat protein n=1 Tax=Phaeovulum sp. W22_SRMD_FR3 TaxID=3240274 RepID=UPI003F9DB798